MDDALELVEAIDSADPVRCILSRAIGDEGERKADEEATEDIKQLETT